jgi:hypothetical protein
VGAGHLGDWPVPTEGCAVLVSSMADLAHIWATGGCSLTTRLRRLGTVQAYLG